MRLVLLDFCDTFVSGQTADEFVNFCLYKRGKRPQGMRRYILKLLERFRFVPQGTGKKRLLARLRGVLESEVDEMATEFATVLMSRLNHRVLKLVSEYRQKGYQIVIVSGGYETYLTKIAHKFQFHHVLGTRLQSANGVLTGKIEGVDCLGEEKIRRILESFREMNIDWKESVAISDHISDRPLLRLVGVPYVVGVGESEPWVLALGAKVLR